MKKIIVVFLFLFLSFNLNAQNLSENKIIAKVGGQIITSVDLINEMKIIAILNKLNPSEINAKKLKENAMNNLVRLSIKKNEIIRFGANSYSANEYENIIKNILNSLQLNMDQFNEVLKKNSITYDFFKKRLEVNLIWNGLIYSIYKNQISVNPLELESEMQNLLLKKDKIKEYNLSEIEFVLDGEKLEKKQKELLEVIKTQNFNKAVSLYSISETNVNEGKIGWINENSLSNSIISKINNLKIGDISEPIKKNNSYLILKINNIKETTNKSNNDLEYINNLKNKIITKKKEEKLNLFSRSHFTKAENSILIEFNE
tara:strand:- start:121 stop:1068 length:948 start_codon:yes stop_codon:yes gene_type:complete